MSNLLCPRVKSNDELRRIMFDVELALAPAILFGVYQFGFPAFKVLIASALASVLTEAVYQRLMKIEVSVCNGSALVTGLLLGLTLPPSVPLYIPIVGSIFATLVVVELFGGYGQHFISPALSARGFLLISFTVTMTTYSVDTMTGATPLELLRNGQTVALNDIVMGSISGCIGEVSKVAILIGFIYLVIRRVISVVTPIVYVLVFSLFIAIFAGHGFDMYYIAAQVFGGGFMFAVVFFSADYVTSPMTTIGRVIYGIILGIITGVYRVLGGTAESVTYAVLFSSLFVPLIDKYIRPKKACSKEEVA